MIKKKCKIGSLLVGFFMTSVSMSVTDVVASNLFLNLLIPSVVEASYVSETDTDASRLDYIENQRRWQRENALDPDQKKLLADAYKMKEQLREPLDPTKNIPVAVEGEELFYDEANGDFVVDGDVVLTTLDQRRFTTDHMDGNLQTQDVDIKGKGHVLQLTPAQARIILNGYRTQYNWGKQIGHMEDVSGKIDSKYVKASRVEFYPEKVVLFNTSMTKCNAKNPDYRMTANKVEYYPGIETISYGCKYWLGSIPVYSVAKQVTKENEKQHYMPKVTYNNSDGLGLKDSFSYPIADRISIYTDLYLSQRQKFKNIAGIVYYTKGFGTFNLSTGFHEDTNGHFVHKAPNLRWDYSSRIGKTPYSYSLAYERGDWSQDNRTSTHTYSAVTLSRDAIPLGKWWISPSVNYSITKESYDNSKVNGMGYDIYADRHFDDRWAMYMGFHYNKVNSKNSVFDYNLDSYSRKFTTGASYRMSDKDRFVAGFSFDTATNRLMDVDYYWFHDIHCSTIITRYRAKRHQWQVQFQFQPW